MQFPKEFKLKILKERKKRKIKEKRAKERAKERAKIKKEQIKKLKAQNKKHKLRIPSSNESKNRIAFLYYALGALGFIIMIVYYVGLLGSMIG